MPIERLSLKKALEKGDVLIGTQLVTASPAVVEIMGYAGFDFVMIDAEHSPCGSDETETLENLIRACRATHIAPLVRVVGLSPSMIQKTLESDPDGIVVPHVKTRDQALEAVFAARFPPLGERGAHFAVRGARYGAIPWPEYVKMTNEDRLLIPLIEDKEAVEDIESILSIDGVDCVIVGPFDLSMSLGLQGQVEHPTVTKYLIRIEEACREKDKHLIEPVWNFDYAKKIVKRGVKNLIFLPDTMVMYQAFREIVSFVDKELRNR